MTNHSIVLLIIVTFLCFISCDDVRVFDEYQNVANSWEKDEKVKFSLPVLDKEKNYNLFINIRNDNSYKFSNLYIISEMNFPNGKVVTDTLEYQMAAPDGAWLGTGFSDLKENKLWYKENVSFAEEGSYTVTLQHAMRKNGEVLGLHTLEGIIEVGFRIEHAQKP